MYYWTGNVSDGMIPLKFENHGYQIRLEKYEDMFRPIISEVDECVVSDDRKKKI